jgi:putative FmdB family regulatory protein
MPTYEYACQKCGQNFDAYQSMRDEPFKVCPKALCRQARWGKGNVRRLLGTGAGLIFKGSGFYTTDYRSDSYKEGAKKESPIQGEKSSSENTAGKADGKPAPATTPAKTPETKAKKDSGS